MKFSIIILICKWNVSVVELRNLDVYVFLLKDFHLDDRYINYHVYMKKKNVGVSH